MFIRALLSSVLLSQAPTAPTSESAPTADAPVRASAPQPVSSVPEQAPATGAASAFPLLTFEEAIALAEKQSPNLDAARARLQQSQELGNKAWSGYLPSITASGSYIRNPKELTFAFPGVPDPITLQKQDQLAGQLSARQALLVPTLWPAIKNAYLGERAAALTAENTRREILFAVAQAYLGAASLRESVTVQEQLLEVRRGFERDAQTRFEVGDAERLAVLRATLDRKQAEQEVVRSRNAYATAKSSLAALLGRPVDFEVAPPEGVKVAVPAEAGDAATAEQTALDKRPDAAAARVNVDLARGGRKQVLAEYLPNLYATGNYQATNTGGLTGQSSTWTVGLALSWTLFDGGLREANLRESSGKIAEASANLRGTEEKIRDEVRKARGELESAEANLSTAEERAKLAWESARLAKQNFDAGATTYLQVTDVNATLAGAQLSAVAETLNVQLSRLSLARAMGLFDPTGNSLVPR
ncbi:TolC family protein [Pyxidicoccus parkwayensis]|uniref:TolC family protein n=1 Tax=Pyxidicoccus parkwayensis TaxID=2813578 RepID=A0ABX7NKT3_9BACT|nr:TolC family protein [Pyxidicoccus parkwaysis]QSQ19469.1 TolC family protein [Pyxidicoccus parkwaysis]